MDGGAQSRLAQVAPQPGFTGGTSQVRVTITIRLTFNPTDRHPNRPLLQMPSGRTPTPVSGRLYEPNSDWIQVDVFQLFVKLPRRIDVEAIGFRLPESVTGTADLEVVSGGFRVPLPDLEAAHALPAMNEAPQVMWIGKPQPGMQVIWHHD